jgi:hypothetical protein
MKTKLIAAMLALACAPSFAGTVVAAAMPGASAPLAFCTGDAGAANISPAGTPAMIQAIFLQGCSNNVYMSIAEDQMSAWGSSASKKGKYYMIGNTNGGAPRVYKDAAGVAPEVSPGTVPTPGSYMGAAQALGST